MITLRVLPTDKPIIVMPKTLMERYGLAANDAVTVEERSKEIVIQTERDPFESLFIAVKKLGLTEEDWEEIHKERHRDDSHWMDTGILVASSMMAETSCSSFARPSSCERPRGRNSIATNSSNSACRRSWPRTTPAPNGSQHGRLGGRGRCQSERRRP